jgi:organic hydroperoxide reductase OsmC/OhrA
MSSPTPHRYRVSLAREGEHAVLSGGVKPPIIGGPPPEFGGSPAWWSPEHLLLSAVSLCFMATFRAVARGLSLETFESEVEGVLDRTPAGIAFVSVELRVKVGVRPGQADLAERLLQSAKRHCIVANSLNVPIVLVTSVREEHTLSAQSTT